MARAMAPFTCTRYARKIAPRLGARTGEKMAVLDFILRNLGSIVFVVAEVAWIAYLLRGALSMPEYQLVMRGGWPVLSRSEGRGRLKHGRFVFRKPPRPE